MQPESKHPIAALILSKLAAKNGKPAPSGADDGEDEGQYKEHLTEIAGDILQAIKDGDASAFADLFHEAFQCCESAPHKEYGDDEDEEDENE
jgi:hypothetical protein